MKLVALTGYCHERNGDDVEFFSLLGTSTECSSRLDDQLDSDGGHQTAEHDDTDGLYSCTANWILVDAWPCCHPASDKHDTRRHKIHEGICCGCEQRQRTSGYRSIQLNDEQAKVDDEGSIDSKFHLRPVLNSVESS